VLRLKGTSWRTSRATQLIAAVSATRDCAVGLMQFDRLLLPGEAEPSAALLVMVLDCAADFERRRSKIFLIQAKLKRGRHVEYDHQILPTCKFLLLRDQVLRLRRPVGGLCGPQIWFTYFAEFQIDSTLQTLAAYSSVLGPVQLHHLKVGAATRVEDERPEHHLHQPGRPIGPLTLEAFNDGQSGVSRHSSASTTVSEAAMLLAICQYEDFVKLPWIIHGPIAEIIQAARVLESNEFQFSQGVDVSRAQLHAASEGLSACVAVLYTIFQATREPLRAEAARMPGIWDPWTNGSVFAASLVNVLSRSHHNQSASARLTTWLCNPGHAALLQQAYQDG
jgi:hypothetical protein